MWAILVAGAVFAIVLIVMFFIGATWVDRAED